MKRVLIVDDDEGNRLSLSFMLEDEGYVVDVAASCAEGRAALDCAALDRAALDRGGLDAVAAYDVVILDHNLGDGLGTSLVPIVRAAMPAARIAMLSGEHVGGAGGGLVDVVLQKGMDPSSLLSAVRALAEQA